MCVLTLNWNFTLIVPPLQHIRISHEEKYPTVATSLLQRYPTGTNTVPCVFMFTTVATK